MGPLAGVRVMEIAGLGAAPFGCMMLADMGADVVRIDRVDEHGDARADATGAGTRERSPLLRNRRSIALDLKQASGRGVALAMVERADILIEAFRPGVAERLGIGPDVCLGRNPRLIYGRMTGWGQTGPLAHTAGHDLNYIGLAGLLHQIGPTGGKPVVPLNVIGDFGGGGMLLAFGVVCALWEARQSGRGQIVDAAMIDGAVSFMSIFFGFREHGQFTDRTGAHMLGGGAHYYDTYATKDGLHLAVAPIEAKFYGVFLRKMGLDEDRWRNAGERDWPALKAELAAIFRGRTRDEWCELFADSDGCVTPVLTLQEAALHPHNRARNVFVDVDGVQQNAPAPRFSRTSPAHPRGPPKSGSDMQQVLADWGIDHSLLSIV